MVEKNIQGPKTGMNRDSASFEVSKEYYTFALNANIQDEHGSGQVVIQNEPSNVKCSGFKAGYRVIGHKYDARTERVYFFLTNPTTNRSEIGYISVMQDAEVLVPNESIVNGEIVVVLETPLEDVVQQATCVYHTILSDDCEGSGAGCLNFSIFSPIHESNVQIKHGKRGTTMWFTDNSNPQRYIELDNLDKYTTNIEPCTDEDTDICLDCNKMRIFPLFNKPCLEPTLVTGGGNLRAGIYEVLIGGADEEGNILTNLYSQTNVIPIFDNNNLVLDQTLLDYQTNLAIKIAVEGYDTSFEYYTLVVIYRSGLDGSATYHKLGVYPNNRNEVTISTLQGSQLISLQDITQKRPTYQKAKGLAQSNGYLYQYGLTDQRTINLQPVVNLLGSFARWSTYMANEDIYKEPEGIANYKGHMRNETYPYAIKFFMRGGYESPLFPLIARPPFESELHEIDTADYNLNDEINSILEYNPECGENGRIYRWQYENTAVETDDCLVPETGLAEETIVLEETKDCFVTDEEGDLFVVDTIETGEFEIPDGNLVSFINNNSEAIIAGDFNPEFEDIQTILANPENYRFDCEPVFGDNCDDIELVSEEIFAISTETEETTPCDPTILGLPAEPNPTCSIYELDGSNNPVEDTDFISLYLLPGETANKRLTPTNLSCSTPLYAQPLTSPQLFNSNHIAYKGETDTRTTLLTTKDAFTTQATITIQLSGSSGSADIVIGVQTYLATYNTSLPTTASDFVTTHAATIQTDFPEVTSVTSVGDTIIIEGAFFGVYETPVLNLSGDLSGEYDNTYFTDKLHSNVIWISTTLTGQIEQIVELTGMECVSPETVDSDSIRVTVFSNCSSTSPVQGQIQTDSSNNTNIYISEADVPGSAFIAIDTPIRVRQVGEGVSNVLESTCGCFSAYIRETKECQVISFTNLTFGKKQTYRSSCMYSYPILNSNCEALPYKKGLFSYVESTETYPCNKELYDSSTLTIHPDDILDYLKEEFELYYTDGIDGNGNYILKDITDFRGKGIRHFKYPDNTVAPFMSNNPTVSDKQKAIIYPIGFHLPDEAILTMLDVATRNGLLTIEERASITHYEIYRGDRRTQRSVIAKGLLYDMYKYQETNNGQAQDIYYPNFPLNSLGDDQYNKVEHPYNSLENNFFTFHSPDTEYFKPTIGTELYVDSYLFGESFSEFDEVRNHPTYIILGSLGYTLATTLAISEAALELGLQVGNLLTSSTVGTGAGLIASAPPAAITYAWSQNSPLVVASIASITVSSFFRAGELRLKWIRALKGLGKPNQFVYYQTTIGHYHQLRPNNVAFQKLRGIAASTYMKDGRWVLANEKDLTSYNINNLDREHSLALNLSSYSYLYPADYTTHDNTDNNLSSRRRYTGIGRSEVIKGNAASPYASLNVYLPAQYGSIDSITWLSTGYCGILGQQDDCSAVFGGDTFISRHTLKRKIPFFRTNAFGMAPLTPFKYSDYHNINPEEAENSSTSHLFLDFEVNTQNAPPIASIVFPSDKSDYRLHNGNNNIVTPDIDGMYVTPPNKFYLYAYGIPSFLVESEINCNFRYAKRERHEDFYPNVQDVIDWTQEQNVSIRQPNTYFYNPVYSYSQTLTGYKTLPQSYNAEIFNRLNDLQNMVIYSRQDVSENSLFDPWLAYRPLDSYNFSQSYGRLTTMKGIESLQLVALFENGFELFGAIDTLADRLTPETKNLGTGGIFAGRPVSFNKTDTGHQGSQNNVMLSCEAGHFWVDAKRGKVFSLAPGGQGLREISRSQQSLNTGIEKWLRDQLPFKILKSFPNIDTDNNYNFVGITMGWDDRTKRLFITKKDFVPKRNDVKYLKGLGFYVVQNRQQVVVSTDDDRYFIDASWTIAYSPISDAWISYYSFKPNYYSSYNNYLHTGINETTDAQEFGLWSHLPFQSSYQVFYGKRYPFIVEYPVLSKGMYAHLQAIEYWLETRKYYNRYDHTDAIGIGFNKAYVYNTYQNTGLLELIYHQTNNPWQQMQFPQYLSDRAQVLQSEIGGRWSFNHLYNAIKKENQGLPIFLNDITNTEKTIDQRLVDQNPHFKDYLRGDYFLVRLINDKESRYKYLFRFATDSRNYHTP